MDFLEQGGGLQEDPVSNKKKNKKKPTLSSRVPSQVKLLFALITLNPPSVQLVNSPPPTQGTFILVPILWWGCPLIYLDLSRFISELTSILAALPSTLPL